MVAIAVPRQWLWLYAMPFQEMHLPQPIMIISTMLLPCEQVGNLSFYHHPFLNIILLLPGFSSPIRWLQMVAGTIMQTSIQVMQAIINSPACTETMQRPPDLMLPNNQNGSLYGGSWRSWWRSFLSLPAFSLPYNSTRTIL